MVVAKLHIICGNCGCSDNFDYEVLRDSEDFDDHFEDGVYIKCNNCCTLHLLDTTISRKEN